MAFFSIIVPVYNVEPYLERCVDSLLRDTCKDLEIILVDDGSTDGSGALCDRLSVENACIRVIHKQNGGLSSARNAGLRIASGEWISFIDSDDWVDPDSYRRMQELLTRPENTAVELVKLGYKKMAKNRVIHYLPCVRTGLYGEEEIKNRLLRLALGGRLISNSTLNTFVLSSCAHLYRRSFLEETEVTFVSEREIGSEDFLFLYSLYMRASSILVTDLCWYNYDTREGSLTRRYRDQLYVQYQRLAAAVRRQMEQTGIYPAFREDYEGLYIALMYTCIINEGCHPGGRISQIRGMGRILGDRQLQDYLEVYRTGDPKSRLLAGMMRLKAALPLCMIQWRKAGNPI